jgi:hypothetical protein
MKLISHRGNILGPVPSRENRPSYIDSSIQLGYDVEIDIRYINNEFWLGHDKPQYKVDLNWLDLRKNNIWIHCKDVDSASFLSKTKSKFKFFCHSQDYFVLTSTNHLWVHDLSLSIDESSIIPLITLEELEKYSGSKPYAICSDYVSKITQ